MPFSLMKSSTKSNYSEVTSYDDLPSPSTAVGFTFLVLQKQGTWFLGNLKRAGLYYSDGLTWSRLGDAQAFFYSNEFKIRNGTDATKELIFNTDSIATGTTREYSFPDSNGTVAIEGRDVTFNTVNGRDVDNDGLVLDRLETIATESFEPTGFLSQSTTTLSFIDLTRTLTIAPTGTEFAYYIRGIRYTKSSPQTFAISDVEGMHYVYFDGDTLGEITGAFDVSLLKDYCYIAAIYWDATNSKGVYVADERHGMVMDWATHAHFHLSFGAQYISGLGLGVTADGDGSLDSSIQGSVSNGTFRDEDILHTITGGSPQTLSPIAQIPFLYRSGASGYWRYISATGYLATTAGTGRAAYNEYTGATWQLTEVDNNSFVLVHIYATNDINNPIFAIVGVNQYLKNKDAQEGANNEINQVGDLPFEELVPIATVIIETSDSFTNAVKSRVVSTDTGSDYIDWRSVQISATTTFGDHNLLSSRSDPDSHPFSAIATDNQIGNPVHIDNLNGIFNHMYSSGIAHGCDLTNNGDGTVDIGAGVAFLRPTGGDSHSDLYSVEVIAQAGLTLTDGVDNYIYYDYNSGSPQFNVTLDETTINMLDKVPCYIIIRNGTTLHTLDIRNQNVDHIGKSQLKEYYTNTFPRKNDGSIVSDAGTLHLACTAGSFYFQLIEYAVPALDTTGTDTFVYTYRDGIGGWTESNASTIDVTNYDDGNGTLAALTAARYAVHWIYIEVSDNPKYYVVYPQNQYTTLAGAEAAQPPSSIPIILQRFGVLIGRAIIKQAGTEITDVETVFGSSFSPTTATTHNGLSGIQGGQLDQYYHLTSAQHTNLTTNNWSLGTYNTDGTNLSLDVANYITITIGGTPYKLAVLT